MRGAGRVRRRAGESFIPQPPSTDHRHHFNSRDSDASMASSRPSSVGLGRSAAADVASDRSAQQSAVRSINSFLAARSSPITLKTPYPSAKDITETLKFVLSCLDFNVTKLDEDLPAIVKSLNCPFKLSKSALRAPNTPSAWPTFLAVINWLVQVAVYNEHLEADSRSFIEKNTMLVYGYEGYVHYIRGDDDKVEALDALFMEKVEEERDRMVEEVRGLEGKVGELEAAVELLKSGPSQREVLEKDRGVLEEDVKKFQTIIGEFTGRLSSAQKALEEKERELEVKMEENRKICEENEELKKKVELQTFNVRDVERMKKELQAVERDVAEAEAERNDLEEKSWNADSEIGHKFKELEALSIECNQALKRLKLGLQYVLNSKGSTPIEVMGIDYKSTLKPALDSLTDDVKKNAVKKLEESISLQQQSSETAAKIEKKSNRISLLESRIGEMEAKLNLLKKEIQQYTNRCAAEIRQMVESIEVDNKNVQVAEIEAAEVLKTSKLQLQETMKRSEEDIQFCACELLAMIDSVSKYKESMESKILEMRKNVSETATYVSDVYKSAVKPFVPSSV